MKSFQAGLLKRRYGHCQADEIGMTMTECCGIVPPEKGMRMKMKSLAGNFLIASPTLDDPNFSQTVVLICDHTDEGAFGLVVNRVLMESFQPLLNNFEISGSSVDMPVYFGGPVKPEQGYIIYEPFEKKYSSLKISGNIGVTASQEMLYDILNGRGPAHYLFALGFSGWSAQQLEAELLTDSWLIAPCSRDVIFSREVRERWRAAARNIGVDFYRYSDRSGTA